MIAILQFWWVKAFFIVMGLALFACLIGIYRSSERRALKRMRRMDEQIADGLANLRSGRAVLKDDLPE